MSHLSVSVTPYIERRRIAPAEWRVLEQIVRYPWVIVKAVRSMTPAVNDPDSEGDYEQLIRGRAAEIRGALAVALLARDVNLLVDDLEAICYAVANREVADDKKYDGLLYALRSMAGDAAVRQYGPQDKIVSALDAQEQGGNA